MNAGIEIFKKTGEYAEKGEKLAILYTNKYEAAYEAKKAYISAIKVCDKKPEPKPLIYKTVF